MFNFLPTFRVPRLRFSLRTLLLMMVGVGVALTIYRWPWEQVDVSSSPPITSRYHRSWTGRAVKHGWEIQKDSQENWRSETLYDEGELRLNRTWKNGELTHELNYRQGDVQGHVLWVNDGVRMEGEGLRGKKHGPWTEDSADVLLREVWNHGKLQGRRTWTTPAGRELQSAEYDDAGQLVKWNGQPIATAVRQWLDQHMEDDELRRFLLETRVTRSEIRMQYCNFLQLQYSIGRRKIAVQCVRRFVAPDTEFAACPLGEVLLQDALSFSCTLAYRFGALHFVPISPESLAWQDRTRIGEVNFEAGSLQEKAWLSEVAADQAEWVFPAACMSKMFEPVSATGITIDTTAIPDSADPTLRGLSTNRPNPPRARRYLLGQHLEMENCYCEQHGNVLVIKRREMAK
ncbi:hypothetical protein [Anatilimnocola floriformis]|uniref:hypothetical protein n=1 Tax=Anatilimnocola floriformis TaxID=2948575 RepID=UPI0020C3F9C6|nr:hypothetical protein [Anatilimnocola floriformis]